MVVRVRSQAHRHSAHDDGATSAEYALIAALIAIVAVTAVALLGGALVARYNDTASQVESATNP